HQPDEIQFHDRCAVCTAALAAWLGYPFSTFLVSELERVTTQAIYQTRVFFVRNLGFVTPTAARRISFADTLRFEKVHEEVYRDFGFELNGVEPGRLAERVGMIKAAVGSSACDGGAITVEARDCCHHQLPGTEF